MRDDKSRYGRISTFNKEDGECKSSIQRPEEFPGSLQLLQNSEERLRTLIHNLPDAVVFKDAAGTWLEANDVAHRTFGIAEQPGGHLNVKQLLEQSFIYRQSAQHCRDTDAEAWRVSAPIRFEQSIVSDQGIRVFDIIKVPVFHADGSRRGLVVIARDITERKASERLLSDSERRYKSLVRFHPDAVVTVDIHGAFTSMNPAWEEISGYPPDELLGKSCVSYVAFESFRLTKKHFTYTLRGSAVSYETNIRHRSGRTVYLSVTNIPMIVDDQIVGMYAICKDVTEQKRSLDTIHRMAYYDSLTGLPNRSYLNQYVSTQLEADKNESFALMFIDLDNFKQMNDTFGHSEGDVLLRLVARRLEEVKRTRDLVVRWAGDEFIVVLHGVSGAREMDGLSLSILEALRKPFTVSAQNFYISASVGICLYPTDGNDVETLLRNGDTALQLAKKQGKNSALMYKPSFSHMATRNLQVGNGLRTAVDNGEMFLEYQPKCNPFTGEVTGFEALLRWHPPTLGIVHPQEFIPLAEDTGMIISIGEYVLYSACLQAKEWTDAGLGRIRMAVNISVRQIQHPDFVEMVDRVLSHTALAPEQLELEITESLLLRVDQGISVLTALRDRGVRIAFDDFGTGYSSLRYLQNVPIQAVKIDKSFVDQMTSEQGLAIISAIIGLVRTLGLTVIAEGVETIAQLEILKSLQCDEIQGFYFSKPLNPQEVLSLLSNVGRMTS